MLNVKFKKISTASYISHIDMQRAIKRTIKRAGIEPAYSAGYNPHAQIKLSSPIPLGVESESEFFTLIAEKADKNTILNQLNAVAPRGLEFLRVWESDENPNFAGKIVACDYVIKSQELYSKRKDLFIDLKESFVVEAKSKDDIVLKESKDLIYGVSFEDGLIKVRLAFGNNTLRIDRFIDAINKKYDLNVQLRAVLKVDAFFVSQQGLFQRVQEVLDKLAINCAANKEKIVGEIAADCANKQK